MTEDISRIESVKSKVDSPAYLLDDKLLENNCKSLGQLQKETGVSILLALKAFSVPSAFKIISPHLTGTCASSLNEARIASEHFGKEIHVYSPAYNDDDFDELLEYASCIVFNSFTQWRKYKDRITRSNIDIGIRFNAGHSKDDIKLYDARAADCRLGAELDSLQGFDFERINGLHCHALFRGSAEDFTTLWRTIEPTIGPLLKNMQWLNFGGGHLLTDPNYNLEILKPLLIEIQEKYALQVYLEPGQAVVSNAGYLIATVLDIPREGFAIVDCSPIAHMPEVLEMSSAPVLIGAEVGNKRKHVYQIGSNSCVSGDVIGKYSFKQPLKPGDRLVFSDMAHYTMVRNSNFNGLKTPSIYHLRSSGQVDLIKRFTYDDFFSRLS
ncbi:MAG: carboxynorspermidine decarboxylase [Spirochaetota bacterium]